MIKKEFKARIKKWKERALSWSQISSFEYDPEQWFQGYFMEQKSAENAEMKFGKYVGEKLASDPKYLPFVPRLSKFEHEFRVVFGKIPLVGFADSFCALERKKLYEYKTGVKKWDQKRADTHGQIDMYLLMHYITTKIRPEEVACKLVWLPTKRSESGDFEVTISFIEPIEDNHKVFNTKRTMKDILAFGSRINSVYKKMEEYATERSFN